MPNRILKESICTSDTLEQLSEIEECFFYRLLVQCDDFGRLDARPAILRAKCYPLRINRVTEADIEDRLQALVRVGLLWLYEVDGGRYLQMTTWDKHQNRRAKNSKYPDPPADDIICTQVHADESNGNQAHAYVPEESRNRGIEESRDEESRASSSDFTRRAMREFESTIGLVSGARQAEEITGILQSLEQRGIQDWWQQALEIAVDNNKRRWSYVRGILNNCLSEGKAPGGKRSRASPHNGGDPNVIVIESTGGQM